MKKIWLMLFPLAAYGEDSFQQVLPLDPNSSAPLQTKSLDSMDVLDTYKPKIIQILKDKGYVYEDLRSSGLLNDDDLREMIQDAQKTVFAHQQNNISLALLSVVPSFLQKITETVKNIDKKYIPKHDENAPYNVYIKAKRNADDPRDPKVVQAAINKELDDINVQFVLSKYPTDLPPPDREKCLDLVYQGILLFSNAKDYNYKIVFQSLEETTEFAVYGYYFSQKYPSVSRDRKYDILRKIWGSRNSGVLINQQIEETYREFEKMDDNTFINNTYPSSIDPETKHKLIKEAREAVAQGQFSTHQEALKNGLYQLYLQQRLNLLPPELPRPDAASIIEKAQKYSNVYEGILVELDVAIYLQDMLKKYDEDVLPRDEQTYREILRRARKNTPRLSLWDAIDEEIYQRYIAKRTGISDDRLYRVLYERAKKIMSENKPLKAAIDEVLQERQQHIKIARDLKSRLPEYLQPDEDKFNWMLENAMNYVGKSFDEAIQIEFNKHLKNYYAAEVDTARKKIKEIEDGIKDAEDNVGLWGRAISQIDGEIEYEYESESYPDQDFIQEKQRQISGYRNQRYLAEVRKGRLEGDLYNARQSLKESEEILEALQEGKLTLRNFEALSN